MVSHPQRALAVLAAAALFGLLAPNARAKFIRPDLEKVPVERIVKNLEELAAKDPKDALVRYNLARVHGMAYALKADTAEVWKGREKNGAWFGYTPAFVPFKPVKTEDEAKLKAAKEHMDQSISAYREAIKLDPEFLPAQLGLAWSLDQKGDKAEAIKAYRDVIEKGWKTEKEKKTGPIGGNYITSEASGYLIALLDADKDKEPNAQGAHCPARQAAAADHTDRRAPARRPERPRPRRP